MEMTKSELDELVENSKRLYDYTRLITCSLTARMVMAEGGSYVEKPFLQYETVLRGTRKENMISLEEMTGKDKFMRIEFIDGVPFSIFSHYFHVENSHYILECTNQLSDHVLTDIVNNDNFASRIKDYNKRLYNDALTGVFNRYYFDEKMQDNQGIYALAMIDVNNFKNVNDTYGHEAGDEALIAIAKSLQKGIRNTDALVRYGGDEFVIIYPKLPHEVLEKRLKSLADEVKKIRLENYMMITLSISIGAVYDVKNVKEGLKHADYLMYKSKSLGLDVSIEQDSSDMGEEQIVPYKRNELNCSGLTDRIFDAFSGAAENQYIYLCNMKTGVSRWSKQAVEEFDLPSEYMADAGKIWADHLHPDDRAAYLKDIGEVFAGKKDRHHLEYRVKNHAGNYIICSCDGVVLKGDYGEASLFAGMIYGHGIIDNVDPVTNLYNEYEFLQILTKTYQENLPSLVMVVGINNFGNFNMIYDYSQGNKILREFAHQVSEIMSGQGIVYRLDGAKLGIQIRDGDANTAKHIYEKIQHVAGRGIRLDKNHIALSISGGALVLSNYKGTARSILSSVIYAMQISKRSRHGSLVFYDYNLGNISISSMEVMQRAKNDIVNSCHGFKLYYQPIYDTKTLKMKGVEALLRWHDEVLGDVSPGEFIPMIENDTSMKILGEFILRKAVEDMKPFVDANPDFTVNVNVAYTQLDDNGGFREAVFGALQDFNFPGKNLCLELTERCQWIGINKLNELIRFFRTKDIKVAIDDFGTGYSSVSLLRNLDVDEIKIDHTFTKEMMRDPKMYSIVALMIEIAAKLSILTCLEGIESAEMMERLKDEPVDYYQGYYFSKPLSLDELNQLQGVDHA